MNYHRHLSSLRTRNIYLNFQHCDCALHIVGVQDENQPAYSYRFVNNPEKMRKKWLTGSDFPCAWESHQPVLLWPLPLQLDKSNPEGSGSAQVIGESLLR